MNRAKDQRKHGITTLLTKKEFELAHRAAARNHMTTSSWIRMLILEAPKGRGRIKRG